MHGARRRSLVLIADASAGLFIVGVFVVIYFFPTIMATRRAQDVASIFALNLLLGWTLVGWVAALVWALKERTAPVIVNSGFAAPVTTPAVIAPRPLAERECPFCLSMIPIAASVCRYCQRDIPPEPTRTIALEP